MSIRNNENNEWLTKDYHVTEKGEKFIKERMKVLENARDISKLPEDVNKEEVNKLLIKINTQIINDNWKN